MSKIRNWSKIKKDVHRDKHGRLVYIRSIFKRGKKYYYIYVNSPFFGNQIKSREFDNIEDARAFKYTWMKRNS